MKFITFHQIFGYEDFIEGFRRNEEETIGLEKGIFLDICKDAQKNLDDSLKAQVDSVDDLEFVLEYKIKPLLEKYFYGDNNGLSEILKKCKLNSDYNE